ncbi:hypothetical protein BDD12DRAFT_190191 [Trichophaea hybrida]|nr:hypothetical protein BDD12DRAFT_190191 [Trichophaea hybrida]
MVRAGIKEAHPAGIYSDMTSDGPVIGTLVVVLDRAKNLPNKKKIGKQDPYAVARLAKEAKRTDTDVRGGQVPRWDKELRFPVRDSPDYKTLKVSVFNDDKRTDLIGETTVRLDQILVPGGGTDDGWRGLKCKEKYAGEILVELTFWDLRPKEKPREAKKLKPVTSFPDNKPSPSPRKLGGAREMGSREKVATIKKRPLPANPMARDYSSSGEERKEKERAREERRATRRHRHSYHPDSRPMLHHPSHSEPPQPLRQPPQPPTQQHRHRQHRSTSRLPDANRHSMVIDTNPRHNMVMAPAAAQDFGGRPEIYDPGDYNGGLARFDDFQRDPYQSEPPPPPPPAHRSFQERAPPMEHSVSGGHPEMPPMEPPFQKQLRHYQSVPAFQQSTLNHQRSFDSRGLQQLQQFHQLQQFTPSYPEANFIHHPSPHPSPNVGYDSTPFDDEPPPLTHILTPASSTPGSRDGPPPPPPPHRRLVGMPSPVIDEPNWDNHQPKSLAEEHGLPSYDSLPQVDKSSRPSFDVTPIMSTGIPLPPSLIPGISSMKELSDQVDAERRRHSYNSAVQPLQIESSQALQSRPSTNYHRPQVEEVQDVQLYQPESQLQLAEPKPLKKKNYAAPMVKPMPIHGERDNTVPAVNASESTLRKASVLGLRPERKPVPLPSSEPEPPRKLQGTPFGPESYDAINPNPAACLEALANSAPPERMIMPGSNRVYDPTDVLRPETFAPEPEPRRRAPRPPPPVPIEHRRERVGRGVSPTPPRGPRLSLPAPQIKQVSFEQPRSDRDHNKRRSVRASKSMAVLPKEGQRFLKDRYSTGDMGGMILFDPHSERERERQMDRERAERDARALVPAARGHENYGYRSSQHRSSGMEVGYYRRGGGGNAPPPVPAKVPLQNGHRGHPAEEEFALSQELSLISIGVGGGGSHGGGRARRARY